MVWFVADFLSSILGYVMWIGILSTSVTLVSILFGMTMGRSRPWLSRIVGRLVIVWMLIGLFLSPLMLAGMFFSIRFY